MLEHSAYLLMHCRIVARMSWLVTRVSVIGEAARAAVWFLSQLLGVIAGIFLGFFRVVAR